MARRWSSSFGMVAAALLLASAAARADEAPRRQGYFEAGRASFGDEELATQVGLRISPNRPARPGFDLEMLGWLTTESLIATDFDLAGPIPLGRAVRLVPRAGASFMIMGGGKFMWMGPGVNTGVGLVLYPDGPISPRADYSWRRFFGEELGNPNPMQSLTVGIGWRVKGGGDPSITSPR